MDNNSRYYELVKAGPDDTEAIRKLYESISYGGPIDIQFRRGADPYSSLMNEGADAEILLLKSKKSGETIGMGACVINDIYYDGEKKRGGYLNGLKLLPEYQKKVLEGPRAFAYMHKLIQDKTDICYASMLKGAVKTQKMFEKVRRSMPRYVRQCTYTTFCFLPARTAKGLQLERGNTAGLNAFFNRLMPKYNLSPAAKINSIEDKDFITWRADGKIMAACAIHNEQKVKNYYLNGYSGVFRMLRYLPTRIFGFPSFPKEKETINHATISMLLFDDDVSVNDRARFIKAASSYAREYDMCMVGLAYNDITYSAFKKIRHIKFSSYVYTINWDEPQDLTSRPIYLDISLM